MRSSRSVSTRAWDILAPSNVEFVGVLLLTLCLVGATSVLSVLLCVKVVVKYCQNVIFVCFSLFFVVANPREALNAVYVVFAWVVVCTQQFNIYRVVGLVLLD